MANQIKGKKGLTVNELIIIGVFTAILSVCSMIGGTLFAITPTLTFYYPIGAAIFPGPVFLLLLAKVPKKGALTIVGVITAVVGLVTGMHWAMCFGGLFASILADIVASTKKYHSKMMNIISYVIYSLGATGTYFAFFINPNAWASTMLKNGTSQEYIDSMNGAATSWVLVGMVLGTILVAGISGFVGAKMLKKQFEKAGITA